MIAVALWGQEGFLKAFLNINMQHRIWRDVYLVLDSVQSVFEEPG